MESANDLKDKTAKGLLWGMANNGATQLLNIVFGIILARLLSQEDYGLASELAIFSAIAAALQESGFISALTNRKNATHEDYNSVFWFNISMSALLYVILWFSAPLIVRFFGDSELLWLSRYAFLGFFFASFSITPRAILFKQMRVKEQAIIGVIALIISGAVGITMALLGMSYWSIVTQAMIYVTVVSILSWKYSGFCPSFHFSFQPIKEMFGFSCKLLITNIFNCINNKLFTLVFGYFYTKNMVGTYDQADKWNKMGSQLITGMVQGVAQPMFVQVGDDPERLQRVFRKMLRFTCFIAFPAMFGLALVAKEFIVIAVGEKWLSSAEMMQLLCIAGAFMPITALYFNFLISRGRSDVYMWNIISQGLVILGLLVAVKKFGWVLNFSLFTFHFSLSDVRLMVVCYVVVYILWLFIWHAFLKREIHLGFLKAIKDLLPFALIAAATMILTYFLTRGIENIYLLLVVRVLMAAVIYVVAMWLSGAKIFKECIGYLRKK